MEKALYIFSGLGADERVFQRLDFSGFKVTFVKWIAPHNSESIEQYATRIRDQITTSKPILIGLSFGGIIAVEVAKLVETEKVILIASAKTRKEIPFYFRFAGKIGFHKHLPIELLKRSNYFSNWFFRTTTEFEEKLLKQILIDTDPIFLSWAIDKIVNWTNQTYPQNTFHIHGTGDRILPCKFVNSNVTIKNGGHLMTLNKAAELNHILRQQLSDRSVSDERC